MFASPFYTHKRKGEKNTARPISHIEDTKTHSHNQIPPTQQFKFRAEVIAPITNTDKLKKKNMSFVLTNQDHTIQYFMLINRSSPVVLAIKTRRSKSIMQLQLIRQKHQHMDGYQ